MVFAVGSLTASSTLRPQPPEPREALRVRVRQRPDPAARRRAVLGEVLRRRDAVHHLRHRDDLPLPVGGRVPRARAVRPGGDGGVHRARVRRLRLHLAQGRVGLVGRDAHRGGVGRRRRRGTDRWRSSVPVERLEGIHLGTTPEEVEEEVERGDPADVPGPRGGMGSQAVDVAGHVRSGVLRDRDDVDRRRPVRPLAVGDGAVPRIAPPGRPDDRRRPRLAEDGAGAPADLRPDARAAVGHLHGRLRLGGRHVHELRRSSRASTRSCRSTSTCPAARPSPRC